MRSYRELIRNAQFAEINACQVHFLIAVVGDFDELKQIAVDIPPVHRMVVDFGDDQRRKVDVGTAIVGTNVLVQPVGAQLEPVFHVVDILCVLLHLVPALVVARNGFGNQCVDFVNASANEIVIQGLSGLGQLKPALGEIATEEVGVKQVFPEFGAVVILVVELPHIVLATVAESIVTKSEIIVPDRTRPQFAHPVLMKKGAERIDIHIGGVFCNHHEIDKRRNVDDRRDARRCGSIVLVGH